MNSLASIMNTLPNLSSGISGSWETYGAPNSWNAGMSFGGSNLGAMFSCFGQLASFHANECKHSANVASLAAGHLRRRQEWQQQLELAKHEIQQLNRQLDAADVRIEIAKKEKRNQELQIQNAKQVHEWMENKFSRTELYDWMADQLRSLYSQSYNLAYDLGRRAEQCMAFELALSPDETRFIDTKNWDNLREGLLAGDRLQVQLERLQAAYLEHERREYELRKHFSLLKFDPLALASFKTTGCCFFRLDEALYDLELPGHYLRRLKSVSVSIPAVIGPYTTVAATLTLVSSWIRRAPELGAELELEPGAAESVVTSSGQNDAGIFNLDHNDPQYLPFERRGAVSLWKLELTEVAPSFDHSSISDVILHVDYTAREGGATFRDDVEQEIKTRLNGLKHSLKGDGIVQMINLRHEFPTAWQAFTGPTNIEGSHEATLDGLSLESLPYVYRGLNAKIKKIGCVVLCDEPGSTLDVAATFADGVSARMILAFDSNLGGLLYGEAGLENPSPPGGVAQPHDLASLKLTTSLELAPTSLHEFYLVLFCSV